MKPFGRWLGRALLLSVVVAAGSWLWSMPNATERGVWKAEASGEYLTLSPLVARLYHTSDVHCGEVISFPAHLDLVEAMEGAWIAAEGDALTLFVDGNIGGYSYTRADALPETCRAAQDTTPAGVFAALWSTMEAHYPFFALHGVDWDSRRALAPEPDATLDDAALYALLQQALAGLDDGHVQLLAGELGYSSPSIAPDWLVGTGLTRAAMNDVARATIGTPLIAIPNTGLEYGLRADGIGYILITHMSTDPGFAQKGSDLAAEAFGEVAAALSGAAGLIIDVRTNPGGDDATALAYASYLTDAPILALTKRTRKGDGWTDPVEGRVVPRGDVLLNPPTILLTSRLTGSGAEIFTMALREMPQVTVMGENTGGGLSDILGTVLPNGWRLGLSHQEYRTPDGQLYEGGGLPPDVVIPPDGVALTTGFDNVLDAAINLLPSL